MDNLLSIENLKIKFNDKGIITNPVENVSLQINKGETVALVGESGSGKSLTAKSIIGLLDSWNNDDNVLIEGDIFFINKDSEEINLNEISEEELDEVRGKEIGFIFQEPYSALNPVMSIGKQVSEMLIKHKNMSEEEAKEDVIELFRMVDLPNPEERYDSFPHQLSGGQLQRVMIAIAISCDPNLLIADEPTTALDVTVQKQILELLKSLQKKLDMSILIITHDLGVVAEFSDRVYVMYSGNILEYGTTYDVFNNPIHPYTKLLLNSVITLDTNLDERLITREYFIKEEGKEPGTVLFEPFDNEYLPMEEKSNNHLVSKMFTKVVK